MYRQLKLINKPTMNLNITPKKILMIKNKLNLILAVFTAFFLVSCENDTCEISFDPGASFSLNDTTYEFNQQSQERWLSRSNVSKDSILLEYETLFTGEGGALYVTFSKTFAISELEKYTVELQDEFADIDGGAGLTGQWPDYHPSNNEFNKVFTKGRKNILQTWAPIHKGEGITLKFGTDQYGEMEWTSYNSNKGTVLNNFQNDSHFVIDSIEVTNIYDNQFGENNFGDNFNNIIREPNNSIHCLLIKITFNMEFYNKEATDKIIVKNGIINAILYNYLY